MADKPFDPIPTRHSLLNRLKDWGDQTSWRDFFDTYGQLLYHVAVKAGLSDTEAQEVVQETVIGVARKIGEFKADPARGSFSAWLMQLTRWRIADQVRKRGNAGVQASAWAAGGGGAATLKRGLQREDDGSTGPMERIPDPGGVGLEAVWEAEWEKHVLAAALERVKRQVSPRQFQMFDLQVCQKLSVAQTARLLQASVASVYMAKRRVGRRVRKAVTALKEGPPRTAT
jgi:RNA polymerase sigma-70 factor (ECF subfamily)